MPEPSTQTPAPASSETTIADVKQLGLWAAIGSLSYVFWIVGAMEMVERLAFYGVRLAAPLYATRPVSAGGLGVTMATFGTLLFCWNFAQTGVSILTGGISDRYGYKETIFASTILKAFAYLIMAWFHSYWGFLVGVLFLAVGTAIFKPGIQATLVKSTNRSNSSMAWGIFYQTVNIGGWIGPLIAVQMREIGWNYVFYINAAVICLNFLLLLTYREPGKDERLAREKELRSATRPSLAREALGELKQPHLYWYLIIFSFWWFMFTTLWDVLAKYLDDWVDTRPMVNFLFGPDGTQSAFWKFVLGMSKDGKTIQPEGIVDIDAFMIMLTCFLFAGLSAKLRATSSMVLGTVLITVGLALLGATHLVGICVGAVVLFSIGEMLASPKFSEFLGNIAPQDKKAMWMGFSQAPILIGWTLEGKLGPHFYHLFSAKDEFARQMLIERGLSPDQVTHQALPIGEAFKKLVEVTGQSPETLTQTLFQSHHVGLTWYIMAAVGLASTVMIFVYGRWIRGVASQNRVR